MKSNYTEKAKAALILAQKEAKKFNQSYVGTEHILIGLLKEIQPLHRRCCRIMVWIIRRLKN